MVQLSLKTPKTIVKALNRIENAVKKDSGCADECQLFRVFIGSIVFRMQK